MIIAVYRRADGFPKVFRIKEVISTEPLVMIAFGPVVLRPDVAWRSGRKKYVFDKVLDTRLVALRNA
jgi:hypothetical protein